MIAARMATTRNNDGERIILKVVIVRLLKGCYRLCCRGVLYLLFMDLLLGHPLLKLQVKVSSFLRQI